MTAPADAPRHKTIQALSLSLLEAAVQKMERQGWRRVGAATLAVPVLETQPPYWVQTMTDGRPVHGNGADQARQ